MTAAVLLYRSLLGHGLQRTARTAPASLLRFASNDPLAEKAQSHIPGTGAQLSRRVPLQSSPEARTEGVAPVQRSASVSQPGSAEAGPSKPPVIELAKPPSQSSLLVASALGEDWNDARYRAKSTRGGQHSQSSIEKKREVTYRFMGLTALSMVAFFVYHLGRPWEDEYERQKIAGDLQDVGFGQRAWLRLKDSVDYFNKPAWDPLLPPPLPAPHQRPYTLCIDLDDLLVHSIWDRQHGWRTAKRPGVDYFLSYLSQFYEIVIFTSQPSYTALPIIERLDPMNVYIPYKLFRDCTRWVGQDLVKDLNYLGRDLSKVLILDTQAQSFKLHPHNGVLVPKWSGSMGDRGLIGMIPFLEAVAILNVPDVRPVLKKYADQGRSHEVDKAFGEEQAKIKVKQIAEWEAGEDLRKKSLVTGGMSRWFGATNPAAATSSANGPPPTLLERERERAQQHWKQESQYFKDNAEIIQKQMDEDRERQLKEMKTSVFSFFSGNMGPAKAPYEGTAAPNV